MSEITLITDLSHWKYPIDYEALAGTVIHGKRIRGAIIKASEALAPDPRFIEHWEGCKRAGLICGAYHFFRAWASPIGQLDIFQEQLAAVGQGMGDFPPSVDVEDTFASKGSPLIVKSAYTMWRELNAADWHDELTIIYTALWYWGSRTGWVWRTSPEIGAMLDELYEKAKLWAANYWSVWGSNKPSFNARPLLAGRWTLEDLLLWQFTDHAKIEGIPGWADLNHFYGSTADLKRYVGAIDNPYEAPFSEDERAQLRVIMQKAKEHGWID